MTPHAAIFLGSILFMGATALFLHWLVPLWDRVTSSMTHVMTERLEELGMDTSFLPPAMRLWGMLLFGSVIICGFVLRMPPIALAVGVMIYHAPRFLLESRIRRRRSQIRDQMVGATMAMANAVRAGLSLAQGMDSILEETSDPLAEELRRIVREFNHGRPLHESITETKDRLKLDSFTMFASAILVSLERGGRLSDTLDRISRSLQENQRLERKLEADTESGRLIVVILAVFPMLFLGGFYFMNPEGVTLIFTSFVGQMMLVGVIGLVVISTVWANKILSIDI